MTPAERQRRCRDRRRSGAVSARVGVPRPWIDAMVERGELPEWSDEDADAIAAVLERWLSKFGVTS